MYIWFLDQAQRLAEERDAIRQLEETAVWLQGVNWFLAQSGLSLDAIIQAHGHDYPVRMTYPTHFPAAPPIVQPQNSARWSTHQYGNGALCLEWGPDTWHPRVSGAMMLESAYKLLHEENPLGTEELIVAPSRHYLTNGQELRGQFGRFYIGEALTTHLASLPDNSKGPIRFSSHWQQESLLVLVQQVQSDSTSACEDTTIPQGSLKAKHDGFFFKTHIEGVILESIKTTAQLIVVLQAAPDEWSQSMDKLVGVMVLDSTDLPHFFLMFGDNKESLLKFALIKSDNAQSGTRIPTDLHHIANKSVGIVGLGSVGSKIALSLARTGITNFLLVDVDIFLPENVCRHVLDWQNIGEHKVDAIAVRLSQIAPNIRTDVSRLHLTGQESNAALNGVLNRLGKCDLLIDATASPPVFNLLAAVAVNHQKPLLWMEVYAGGIGGMIARSRPEIDPDPHTMRRAYYEVTADTVPPDLSTAADYSAETNAGEVLIANDADVSLIAAAATKLALDTLSAKQPSLFPYSMYLIGLANSWLFQAPFHTFPIATAHLRHESATDAKTNEQAAETVAFLREIIVKCK